MRIDPAGVPGVVVLVTGNGDEHLDAAALTRELAALGPGTDVVVIVGGTVPASLEVMTSQVPVGGVAVRGEPSVDAVKRVDGGLVVSTLDRARVVRPRLPLAASPGALVAALAAGPSPGTLRVADLVARFDPGGIVFVETGRPEPSVG